MVVYLRRTCFNAGRRIGLLSREVRIEQATVYGSSNLPNKHVHSGVHAVFDITVLRECTERHNWRRVTHLSNETSTLDAVEVRHL
jgi:hypothetical protein